MDIGKFLWKFNGHQYPFYFRAQSEGDNGVIGQIFNSNDYALTHWEQGRRMVDYCQRNSANARPLIIDAGANIGASPLYFHINYPGALVYAVEPDHDNCTLLRLNCGERDIVIFEGAIACNETTMYLHDPGISDWGFRVLETGTRPVKTISPTAILKALPEGSHFPLICKIDIEGGEDNLFSASTDWVDQFPLIVIELHDWLLPFSGSSRNFQRVMAQHDFDVLNKGENLFCFNRRILSA
jgi:FkbM family methyltransferase